MSLATLFFLRTPAVSMATNCRPSRSKRTSTLSRVVPATSLTIMRSLSARQLMNVLLPVLRRPTMASFIAGSRGAPSPPARRGGTAAPQRGGLGQQLVAVAVLAGADAQHAPLAELVKLGGLGIQFRRVALVRHQQERLVDVPQLFDDFLIQWRDAGPAVHDEDEDVGLVEGVLNLLL